ncbi:MAG: winged helix-turn-helix transcriptional regulator [Flavobacteriales bacterium]|nr:winged helix-turn-helix transcriptional regulator [Flavobacteriales bacterium]
MIGHQLLLSVGDSTSRVLPVRTEGNTHILSFENAFSFQPDTVSAIINSLIESTGLASNYIVQFVTCDSNQIVHSYKVSSIEEESVPACMGRSQPKACYYLKIIDLDRPDSASVVSAETTAAPLETEDFSSITKVWLLLTLFIMLLASLLIYFFSSKPKSSAKIESIQIGKYRFNPKTMELILGNEKIELTSKECDLLQLLYESVNDTVDRDTILRMVWNDEGDYVGRTLDVFISKLRKKLEADSRIKIANIRGVGYKLIIDV